MPDQVLARRWLWPVALALISFSAVGLVLFATPHGSGVEYDSISYLSAAENLSAGVGLGRFNPAGEWEPLTHFPPLYPVAMATLASMLNQPVLESARMLAALSLGTSVFVSGLWVWAVTRRPIFALAAGASFVVAADILELHLWVMSEPLFFPLLLGHLGLLWLGITRRLGWAWLAAGVLAGLASLTRYAGLALLPVAILAVLVANWLGRERPWQGIAQVGLGALLPLALGWLLRDPSAAGLTNRSLSFHPPTVERLRQGARTLANWLPIEAVPKEIRFVLVILLFGLLLWRLVRRLRSKQRLAVPRPLTVATLELGFFGLGYVALLLASLTFFDASTRLHSRILSPLLAATLIWAAMEAGDWLGSASGRWRIVWLPILAVALPLSVGMLAKSGSILQSSLNSGFGFQSASWRNSETVQALRRLNPPGRIYSNEAFPLSFLLDRPVFPVPERIDPVLAISRPDFESQMDAMRSHLYEPGALLVLLHPQSLRVEMPSLEVITEGMELLESFDDGAIYAASTKALVLETSSG